MAPDNRKYDVFISYPHAQKVMADAVCATLEQTRIRCWIAPRDVLPGEPFAKAIIRAMNQSRLFVLVFSAETNESTHVKNEVERAVSKGLSIIVFRVQDVVPTEEMEFYLMRRHWLDAMTPPVEAHFQQLVDAVRALLAMPALETSPSEGEQQVASLRMRTREAAAKGDWDQALMLLEQAEAILPDDPAVAEMLQTVKREQYLANLRRQAEECLAHEDWAGAITSLEEAAQLAPDDANLAASLELARRHRLLSERKAEAQRLAAMEDWQGVLVLLKPAQEQAPDDKEIQQLAAQAARAQHIVDLRERASTAYNARQWDRALPLLEELRAALPQDGEAREMLATATREHARQRQLTALVTHAETTTTRAREAVRVGQWDAAERAWQDAVRDWGAVVAAGDEFLAAAPKDALWQERVAEARICQLEAMQKAGRLRSLAQGYDDAQIALNAGQPDQAVPLLAAIVAEMPAYRDAAQLLRRAQRKSMGQSLSRGRALWLGAGALAVVGLAAIILFSGLLALPQSGAMSERTTTLQDALASQRVEAQIRGTGTAYGDCITARLTRRTRDPLSLELAQGTLLLSKDTAVQDMVVMGVRAAVNQDGGLTPADTIRIADDSPQEYLFEAYSLDSRLAVPSVGDAFVASGLADRSVRRILQAAEQLRAAGVSQSPAAIQLALWLLDESQNRTDICLRIGCQPATLALAEQILVQAGAVTSTPTASPTPPPATAPHTPSVASTPTPTPTAPSTATTVATPTPIATATDTPTATVASTPTATATSMPTATATRPAPTASATATRVRATAPATVPPAGALTLQSPDDGQIFLGRDARVRLAWSPVTWPLAATEYYLVTIFFPHEQETWTDYQWTRDPELILPGYLYDNVTGDRSLRWHISLVRLDTGSPTGNPQGRSALIVAPGAPRSFRWLPEAGDGGGDGSAPTFTPRPPAATMTPRP